MRENWRCCDDLSCGHYVLRMGLRLFRIRLCQTFKRSPQLHSMSLGKLCPFSFDKHRSYDRMQKLLGWYAHYSDKRAATYQHPREVTHKHTQNKAYPIFIAIIYLLGLKICCINLYIVTSCTFITTKIFSVNSLLNYLHENYKHWFLLY